MKPKFRISEIVRIKATGEKAYIEEYMFSDLYIVYNIKLKLSEIRNESELKPYRPSRTGKYRNEKGQFVSKEYIDWLKEIDSHLKFERNPDSKQRNYQKKDQQWFDHDYIIKSLERIEKKIDELGRRV